MFSVGIFASSCKCIPSVSLQINPEKSQKMQCQINAIYLTFYLQPEPNSSVKPARQSISIQDFFCMTFQTINTAPNFAVRTNRLLCFCLVFLFSTSRPGRQTAMHHENLAWLPKLWHPDCILAKKKQMLLCLFIFFPSLWVYFFGSEPLTLLSRDPFTSLQAKSRPTFSTWSRSCFSVSLFTVNTPSASALFSLASPVRISTDGEREDAAFALRRKALHALMDT